MRRYHVAGLAVAPVKALGLSHPEALRLDARGAAGDRRFAVVGPGAKPVSIQRWPGLLRVSAHTDAEATRLRLGFPDGAVVEAPVEPGPPVTMRTWRRELRGTRVAGPWDAALRGYLDAEVRLVRLDEPAVDDADVSLAGCGSVEALAAATGDPPAVTAGRFRSTVLVAGTEPHEEDAWVGRRLQVGEAVVSVREPIARCAVTCHHPTRGVRDRNTLRVLERERGLSPRRTLDFGVYASVEAPGTVRVGDAVTLV